MAKKIKDISPKASVRSAALELVRETTPGEYPMGDSWGGMQVFSRSFKRGYGDDVFGVDENGMFLGAAEFADAPFSVNFQGESILSKVTIKTNTSGARIELSSADNTLKLFNGSGLETFRIDTNSLYLMTSGAQSPYGQGFLIFRTYDSGFSTIASLDANYALGGAWAGWNSLDITALTGACATRMFTDLVYISGKVYIGSDAATAVSITDELYVDGTLRIASGGRIYMPDGSGIEFGAGTDVEIFWHNSSSYLGFRNSGGSNLFRINSNGDLVLTKDINMPNGKRITSTGGSAIEFGDGTRGNENDDLTIDIANDGEFEIYGNGTLLITGGSGQWRQQVTLDMDNNGISNTNNIQWKTDKAGNFCATGKRPWDSFFTNLYYNGSLFTSHIAEDIKPEYKDVEDGDVVIIDKGKIVPTNIANDRRVFGVIDRKIEVEATADDKQLKEMYDDLNKDETESNKVERKYANVTAVDRKRGVYRRKTESPQQIEGRPAILGIYHIKVIGPVQNGDDLVTSAVSRYAMANNNSPRGCVIAQAMEDFNGESGIIKAMIRKF